MLQAPLPSTAAIMTRPPARAPQAALLADARRLHLNDGPIDLVIEANGAAGTVAAAYRAAAERFVGLLDALCEELPLLRRPALPGPCPLKGRVARRMWSAVEPHARAGFITPMAAVAGAVAEEVLDALILPGISRAYVNNGGDIALFLSPGSDYVAGLVDRPDLPRLVGTARVDAQSPVRGIATSGWRGRSFSLGIADAVTVLAPTAAAADAAATVIANAVDVPNHPGIVRVPARDLQPDNDLGLLKVTRGVPELASTERDAALEAGLACAHALMARGLICAAALHLQGSTRSTHPAAGALSGAPPVSLAIEHERGVVHA